jgi:betaine lipid synthase
LQDEADEISPAQNHLLELKVAAYSCLGYSEFWKLFGDGVHENFRELLVSKLSPHLSSYAFQYWLQNGPQVFSRSQGLYYSGGSRHAIKLAGYLFRLFGLTGEVKRMCEAQTLAEQKEVWEGSIRKVLLNRLLSWTIVQNEAWLWKALGVPANQRNIIMTDYDAHCDATGAPRGKFGRAVWEYVVNTLDPVVANTLLADDNHYYLLTMQGRYSRRCHADYLAPAAHAKLSAPGAFAGLRIHTDEICEVIDRMAPGTLTVAVVMDSMDWFDPLGDAAEKQIRALNHALKFKGRVLLRSAGMEPWYLRKFEEGGFQVKCINKRVPGTCVDR